VSWPQIVHDAPVEKAPLGGRARPTAYTVVDQLAVCSQWIIPNRNVINLERGVVTRVFKVKDKDGNYADCPRPTTQSTAELNMFRKVVLDVLEPHPFVPLEMIPGLYIGPKRKRNQSAVDSFRSVPLRELDAHISAHTKVEKVNVALGIMCVGGKAHHLHAKDPRVIQARTPRYNVKLAQYLKLNEHRYFSAIDIAYSRFNAKQDFSRTIMKGLNAAQQGKEIAAKWAMFQNPIAVRIDAKRFDQHCSPLVIRFEHTFYKRGLARLLNADQQRELAWLLQRQLANKCFGRCHDGTIKYTAHGRMSGDLNTGLGNVVIMCSLMYGYFSHVRNNVARDFPALDPIQLQLVNNGDDCCVIVEREHLDYVTSALEDWFLRYGFEMDIEGLAHSLEQIKFCQSHPIWTPHGHVMVRAMPMSFAKDSINLDPRVDFDTWRTNIGTCGLALTAGIPMAQAYYSSMLGSLPMKRELNYTTGMEFLAHGMESRVLPIHPLTRVSVYNAFGILPDRQRCIEKYFLEMTYSKEQVLTWSDSGVIGVGTPLLV